MNKTIAILFLVSLSATTFAQLKLVKDLDSDHIKDTVYIDAEESRIICRLSGRHFRKLQSKKIDFLNETAGIVKTKGGFYFYNSWMRAGYHCQFRYNVTTKTMQLTNMNRWEAGGTSLDGSGMSSINLLNSDYVGNWNYFDEEKQALLSLSTIKTKMVLPKTTLQNFSDETYFAYAGKCTELYEKQKEIEQRKRSKKH